MKIVKTRPTELYITSVSWYVSRTHNVEHTCPAGVARPRHDMRPTVESFELPMKVLLAQSNRIADIASYSCDTVENMAARVILVRGRGRRRRVKLNEPPYPLVFHYICTPSFSAPHAFRRWPRPLMGHNLCAEHRRYGSPDFFSATSSRLILTRSKRPLS